MAAISDRLRPKYLTAVQAGELLCSLLNGVTDELSLLSDSESENETNEHIADQLSSDSDSESALDARHPYLHPKSCFVKYHTP